MKKEEHYLGVGKIVTSLQSLELVLRVFICDSKYECFTVPIDASKPAAANHVTNYDTLGQLVDKYNAESSDEERGRYCVNRGLIGVRDALAHGRLISKVGNPDFPLTLYKFGKPDKSAGVPIECIVVVTSNGDWLESSARSIHDAAVRGAPAVVRREVTSPSRLSRWPSIGCPIHVSSTSLCRRAKSDGVPGGGDGLRGARGCGLTPWSAPASAR